MSAADRLAGEPMDPAATPGEPLPQLPGLPFGYRGASVVIVGPTGRGRSSLLEAAMYDAALAGTRTAYLGSEVGQEEFNARAAATAKLRGEQINEELRERLANCRYLDLAEVIAWARTEPTDWTTIVADRYEWIGIDPLSAVASTLGVDFDSNTEYVAFYDRLIQPLTQRGVGVVLVENVGHADDAKARAKGASAKSDRADVTISCTPSTNPPGLIVKAGKVRSVRAPFRRGDEWLFTKDTQRIVAREHSTAEPFRPTALMAKVSKAVEQAPGLGKKAIREAVTGKNATIDLALAILIAEGYIGVQEGGKDHPHHSICPYREDSDSGDGAHLAPPCPDGARGKVQTDRAPLPLPLRKGKGTGTEHGHDENGDRAPDADGAPGDADYVARFRLRQEQGLV